MSPPTPGIWVCVISPDMALERIHAFVRCPAALPVPQRDLGHLSEREHFDGHFAVYTIEGREVEPVMGEWNVKDRSSAIDEVHSLGNPLGHDEIEYRGPGMVVKG